MERLAAYECYWCPDQGSPVTGLIPVTVADGRMVLVYQEAELGPGPHYFTASDAEAALRRHVLITHAGLLWETSGRTTFGRVLEYPPVNV